MTATEAKWKPPLPYVKADLGLLQLFQKIEPHLQPINIESLRGKQVAIDAYSLLYKAAEATGCCRDLALGMKTSVPMIQYCLQMAHLLVSVEAKPTFVFHGRPLQMADFLERDLQWYREKYLKWAIVWNEKREYAMTFYAKAFAITPLLAHQLLEALRGSASTKFIVAPYDANAQLAYLLDKQLVEAVITDDPSLILFGRTQNINSGRIIFKLGMDGRGMEFQMSELLENKLGNGKLDFTGFTKENIQLACLFSGCSYVPSQLSFDFAHQVCKEHGSFRQAIEAFGYCIPATPTYIQDSRKALMALNHQQVYDPVAEEMVHLSEIAKDDLDYYGPLRLDFLGYYLPGDVAKRIAQGELDPRTLKPFEDIKEPEAKKLKVDSDEVMDIDVLFQSKKKQFFRDEDAETDFLMTLGDYDSSEEEIPC